MCKIRLIKVRDDSHMCMWLLNDNFDKTMRIGELSYAGQDKHWGKQVWHTYL